MIYKQRDAKSQYRNIKKTIKKKREKEREKEDKE